MSDSSYPKVVKLEQLSSPEHTYITWMCPFCHRENFDKIALETPVFTQKCLGCGIKYNVYLEWCGNSPTKVTPETRDSVDSNDEERES
jgi:hypothetical protein